MILQNIEDAKEFILAALLLTSQLRKVENHGPVENYANSRHQTVQT